MKLHVLANNAEWKTLPAKVENWKRKMQTVKGIGEVETEISYSSFDYIPLVEENEPGEYMISPEWINQFWVPGTDLLLIIVTEKDWKKWGGDNKNYGRFYRDTVNPVIAYVIADELSTLKRKDGVTYNRCATVGEHEIQHQLCRLSGQKDLTHYYRDRGDLNAMWEYITFEKGRTARRIAADILRLLGELAKKLVTS